MRDTTPLTPRSPLRRTLTRYAALFLISTLVIFIARSYSPAHHSVLAQSLENAADTASVPARAIARLGWRRVDGFGPFPDAFLSALFWTALVAVAHAAWVFARRRVAPSPVDHTRRRFLVDASASTLLHTSSAGAASTIVAQPWDLRTRRYTLPIRDLSPRLAGMRIVHISDTHLGTRIPTDYVRAAVRRAVAIRPDLVALVGDYLERDTRRIDEAAEIFRPLIERFPTVSVLGNHDWYADGPAMRRALELVGSRHVDNDRVFFTPDRSLSDEHVPESLCIAGLGDLHEDFVYPDRAFQDVPDEAPRILLSHNPDAAELHDLIRPSAPRVDLMLSGHTHGGQVRLPFLGAPIVPSVFGQKYAEGLVQGPAFPVLISRGVGMSIIPVRFRCPPEILEITLVPSEPA